MVYIKISLLDRIVVPHVLSSRKRKESCMIYGSSTTQASCWLCDSSERVSKRREGLKRALVRRLANPYILYHMYDTKYLKTKNPFPYSVSLADSLSLTLLIRFSWAVFHIFELVCDNLLSRWLDRARWTSYRSIAGHKLRRAQSICHASHFRLLVRSAVQLLDRCRIWCVIYVPQRR